MNLIKKWRLFKELKRKRKIDSLLDNQIIDAMEQNKELEKTAKKNFKLKLLEAQQKKTLESLGVETEEEFEDEDDEEEEEDDDAIGLVKELFKKGINTPSKAAQSSTGFPMSDTSTIAPKVAQSGSNALTELFDKVKALPLDKQEKLIDLAGSYL